MIKGTIYISGNMDAERLTTLLATNGYEVRVKAEESIDTFGLEFRIDYKRKEEFDEP